jgi:hypothetical protein
MNDGEIVAHLVLRKWKRVKKTANGPWPKNTETDTRIVAYTDFLMFFFTLSIK